MIIVPYYDGVLSGLIFLIASIIVFYYRIRM